MQTSYNIKIIFVNSLSIAEVIVKNLTEVLIQLGLKLNSSKFINILDEHISEEEAITVAAHTYVQDLVSNV